jgi:hypothetical protein
MKSTRLLLVVRTLGALFLACVGLQDAAAAEPRYRLVEGKGYTVCEAFLKNLNAFPSDEPPMVCEQRVHPTHPEFTRPTWEELDIQKHLTLIYEAESLLWKFTPIGSKAKPFDEWEKAYQERIRSGEAKPRLRKAVLNLNGSGAETLIWYEPLVGSCDQELTHKGVRGPGGHIFVQQSTTGALQPFGGLIGTEGRTDVLLYKNTQVQFLTAGMDMDLSNPDQPTPVWKIGLHPVSSRLTNRKRFLISKRCYYNSNR